jgi:hypothetical protein
MREFRLVWKREGLTRKEKRWSKLASAEKYRNFLTSDKPWEVFGLEANAYSCCSGFECGCGGARVKDIFLQRSKGMPKIVYAKMESREVGDWYACAE